MASCAWKVIRRDLREVQVHGVCGVMIHVLCCPYYYGEWHWTVTPRSRGCGIVAEAWRRN